MVLHQHPQVSQNMKLYPNKLNTHTNSVMCQKQHRQIVSVSSGFGQTTTFNIAPESFCRNVVLHIKLPDTGANQVICAMVGERIVRQIRLRVSGSEEIVLPGWQSFFYKMAQCESQQKKLEYVAQTGGAPVFASSTAGDFYCILKLPWSGLRKEQTPYPNYLLNSPVQLVIQFEDLSNIVSGSAASSYSQTFSLCELLVENIVVFSDENIIKLSGNQELSYPYKRLVQVSNVAYTSSTSTPVSVNLSSIQAGKLNSILLFSALNSDISNLNWFRTQEMTDMKLELNGSLLHYFKGTSAGRNAYRMFELGDTGSAGYVQINYNNSGSNATENALYYLVKFGLQNPESDVHTDHIANAVSLANNTLQLSFLNTQNGNASTLYVMYIYEYEYIISSNSVMNVPII